MALALRTVDLASVPRWFTDEGLWAMPPRDQVLFGYWTLGPWHHYYLSPLFTGSLLATFRAFGPGLIQARALDAVLGVVAVSGTLVLGRALKLGLIVPLAAAAAVAFDGPSIITNRSVLLENLQTVLLLGCAIVAVSELRFRRWLLALFLAGALLAKLLSVYAIPVLLAYALWRGRLQLLVRDGVAIAAGALLAGALFFAIALPDVDRFVATWQVEFGIRSLGVGAYEEASSLRATAVYYLTRSPVLLLALGLVAARVAITRRLGTGAQFLGLWTVIGIAAMSAQGYTPPRYFVPLVPFAWLFVFASLSDFRPRILLSGLALSAVFSLGALVGYYYVLGNRDSRGPEIAAFVERTVPPGERVLGPLEYLVATRVVGLYFDATPRSNQAGFFLDDELAPLGVGYVVTSPQTPQAPDQYQLVRDFGDVRVYGVAPS